MSRSPEQKRAARKLLKKLPGPLIQIDLSRVEHPEFMTRAFSNNRYVVMIDDNALLGNVRAIKVMVQRHDDRPIPGHWREMQGIKNSIFGREATAIEFYPPESQLCDEANIYWMWVIPSDIFQEEPRG